MVFVLIGIVLGALAMAVPWRRARRTAESKDRADIQAPPTWFAMIEATDGDALSSLLPDSALAASGARGPFHRGLYRLEYVRTKTAFT